MSSTGMRAQRRERRERGRRVVDLVEGPEERHAVLERVRREDAEVARDEERSEESRGRQGAEGETGRRDAEPARGARDRFGGAVHAECGARHEHSVERLVHEREQQVELERAPSGRAAPGTGTRGAAARSRVPRARPSRSRASSRRTRRRTDGRGRAARGAAGGSSRGRARRAYCTRWSGMPATIATSSEARFAPSGESL